MNRVNGVINTYKVKYGKMMIYNNAKLSSVADFNIIEFSHESGEYFFDVKLVGNWIVRDIFKHSEFVFIGEDIKIIIPFCIKDWYGVDLNTFRFVLNVDKDLQKHPLYTVTSSKYANK